MIYEADETLPQDSHTTDRHLQAYQNSFTREAEDNVSHSTHQRTPELEQSVIWPPIAHHCNPNNDLPPALLQRCESNSADDDVDHPVTDTLQNMRHSPYQLTARVTTTTTTEYTQDPQKPGKPILKWWGQLPKAAHQISKT